MSVVTGVSVRLLLFVTLRLTTKGYIYYNLHQGVRLYRHRLKSVNLCTVVPQGLEPWTY